jgi:hypothetical protein
MTTAVPEDAPRRRSGAERSSTRTNSDAERSRSAPQRRKCSPVMKSIKVLVPGERRDRCGQSTTYPARAPTASLSEIFAMELITTTAVRCRPTILEFSGGNRANARLSSAATKG